MWKVFLDTWTKRWPNAVVTYYNSVTLEPMGGSIPNKWNGIKVDIFDPSVLIYHPELGPYLEPVKI